MLFPGGDNEVGKGAGGEVELRWKAHADFVRMAARFDAIIVPFAALGAEDAGFGNALGESAAAAAGPLLEALFGDPALSEVGVSEGGNRGLGLPSLVVPSLQRVYFKFGEPLVGWWSTFLKPVVHPFERLLKGRLGFNSC